MDTTITSIKGETGRDARRRIRAGAIRMPTSGMAPGYVQGNLAILPKELAADFARFCSSIPSPARCSASPSRATGACRRWARISTSAPTSRSTASGRRAS